MTLAAIGEFAQQVDRPGCGGVTQAQVKGHAAGRDLQPAAQADALRRLEEVDPELVDGHIERTRDLPREFAVVTSHVRQKNADAESLALPDQLVDRGRLAALGGPEQK